MKKIFIVLLVMLISISTAYATRYYVKPNGNDNSNGLSWATARKTLEWVIGMANPGDEIWVAAGTYIPYRASFNMSPGVAIYGGFRGTEESFSQRDWRNNPSILKGSPSGGPVIYNHLTIGYNAILDGFTIRDASVSGNGGGIYNENNASPTINNCSIINNTAQKGAAIYNLNSSPRIYNTVIMSNTATASNGAAVYNENSNPVLYNVAIRGNRQGGMYNKNCNASTFRLLNVLISGNVGSTAGGMLNDNSSPNLTNVTIAGNVCVSASSSDASGGIYNSLSPISSPNIHNSIIWGNYLSNGDTVDVEGGSPSYQNSIYSTNSAFPNFVSYVRAPDSSTPATGGDFRLATPSVAINSGYNYFFETAFSSVTSGYTAGQISKLGLNIHKDLGVSPRIYNSTIDMGAYEYASPVRLYVKLGASGTDGFSWATAYTNLTDALNAARTLTGMVNEIWVAAGAYQAPANDFYTMINNMAVYGGFSGSETSLGQRNWQNNVTVLQGNGNSVIRNDFSGTTTLTNTILDGFTIRNGNAFSGGGIYNYNANPTIRNCRIESNVGTNSGGGMFNEISSPNLINVAFYNNTSAFGGGIFNTGNSMLNTDDVFIISNYATGDGGGMANYEVPQLTLYRVTFDGNTAGSRGGGIMTKGANILELDNVVISGNVSLGIGGGILNVVGNIKLNNVTIAGNRASTAGDGIYNFDLLNVMEVYNSIIWGNNNKDVINNKNLSNYFYHCLLENSGGSGAWNGMYGIDGGGNIDINPNFVNYVFASVGGNYRVHPGSPAINRGNNAFASSPVDRDGKPRIMGSSVDMGAYEFYGYNDLVPEISEAVDINDDVIENGIKIYPNPARSGSNLYVELDISDKQLENASIEVFNTLGARAAKYQVTEKKNSIAFPKEKGVYLLKIISNNKILKLEKVIVM